MGRQVNFFMLPEDHAAIDPELEAVEPCLWFPYRSSTPRPKGRRLDDLVPMSMEWIHSNLARTIDVPQLRYRFIERPEYWCINTDAPVVEYMRSIFNNKRLTSGRLYFKTAILAPDEQGETTLVVQPDDFLKWGDRLLRILRRRLKRYDGNYVGPAALRWVEATGTKLV